MVTGNITDYDSNTEIEELRQHLIGRSVVSVSTDARGAIEGWFPRDIEGMVTLDDGTVLKLAGNDGGCACSAGCYDLTLLNDMPINGIMDVQVEVNTDEWRTDKTYHVFVLAQDERIELARFEGSDGSGYYGSGFWFEVSE